MSGDAEAAMRAQERRVLRTGGLIACLIGTLVMVSGRFMAGAPVWLAYAGLSVIVLGWGLFALALFQRGGAPRVRANTAKS